MDNISNVSDNISNTNKIKQDKDIQKLISSYKNDIKKYISSMNNMILNSKTEYRSMPQPQSSVTGLYEIQRSGLIREKQTLPIKINFISKNSCVIIEEPRLINHLYIDIGENCCIYIEKDLVVVDVLHIVQTGSNSILFIGEHCDFINSSITQWENNTVVYIGDNNLFGAFTDIQCGDGHTIYDSISKIPINIPEYNFIGNHNWFAKNSAMLKNSYISNDCIVARNAIITKNFYESGCILAGTPAKIVKRGVNWEWDKIFTYRKNNGL